MPHSHDEIVLPVTETTFSRNKIYLFDNKIPKKAPKFYTSTTKLYFPPLCYTSRIQLHAITKRSPFSFEITLCAYNDFTLKTKFSILLPRVHSSKQVVPPFIKIPCSNESFSFFLLEIVLSAKENSIQFNEVALSTKKAHSYNENIFFPFKICIIGKEFRTVTSKWRSLQQCRTPSR